MKNIILLALLIFTNILIAQTSFSKGFKKGYEKGYCQNQGFGCVSPLAPVPPMLRAGESDNNYTDGYNRGFEKGLNDSKSNKETVKNNDNIYKGSTNGYPNSPSNKGYDRQPVKYNKTKSSINHSLLAEVLNQKQRAIDRERNYLQSLSYEERQELIRKKNYSERKNYLYSKNLKRWIKADKKQQKINKKIANEIKKNTKIFNKSSKIKLSEISNGWYKTIVNIKVNYENNYVERLVYFNDGIITRYVGGAGFLSNIYTQSKTNPYEIALKVGYEKNETASLYVSFVKNNPIKLKEEPIYPTLIKFYTTTTNQGKMFVYLNGVKFSDYFTLEKYFRIDQNITCEQTDGMVIFYVGQGEFDFYAHNSVNQWNGKINTTNRYCILKELSN